MFLVPPYQNNIREKNDWFDCLIKQSSKTNVKNKNVNKKEKTLEIIQNKPESLKQRFSSIPSGIPLYDKLIVIREKKILCEFEFKHNLTEVIIGHHLMANIVLDGPKVSPFHCKISCQNGHYFLQDLDSQYGTYLNGKKIIPKHSVELQNATSIRVMAFQIQLEIINNQPTTISNSQNLSADIQQFIPHPSIEEIENHSSNFLSSKDLWHKNKSTKQEITELIVTEIRDESHCAKTFRLMSTSTTPIQFSYLPGQFITLLLTIDGQTVQRCYSISSSPSRPQTLDITVKRVPGGLVSNWLCDQLKPGDTLKMKSPRGSFCHLLKPTKKLLFIGAGSGVVPLMSMLRWQFDMGSNIESKAIFSFKKTKDILFRKEIEWINEVSNDIDIGITLTKLNKRAAKYWNGLCDRVDTSLLTSLVSDLHQRDVYLCGPEEFMCGVKEILKRLNFPEKQIYSESFTHAEIQTPSLSAKQELTKPIKGKSQNNKNKQKKKAIHQITFTKSNKVIQVDENTTLLAVAEKENLGIEFSCRTGFCAECMIKCTSGQVRMDDKCEIDEHEREQGWIFSCCSYALSDLVIEA